MSATQINFHNRFSSLSRSERADAPDSGEISELCANVIGSDEARSKLPLLLARYLEERFILAGWPVGRVFGSEPVLASQYQVGRNVMRETARILEARGCARMKRGPQGGLEIVQPTTHDMYQGISDYANLTGLTASEIVRAWVTLQLAAAQLLFHREGPAQLRAIIARHAERRVLDSRAICADFIAASGNKLLAILVECLSPFISEPVQSRTMSSVLHKFTVKLLHDMERTPAVYHRRLRVLLHRIGMACVDRSPRPFTMGGLATARNPAARVVRALMRGMDAASWRQGILLGNEFELCERFEVDKSVVRQAIRMMEAAEIADARAGRGRGLTSRRPSTAPLSRQFCSFIASRAVSVTDVEQFVEVLETEIAGMAARDINSEELQLVDSLLADLANLRCSVPIGAFQRFERFQHDAAKNTLLCAFLDGAKSYLSWNLVRKVTAPPPIAELYAEHTSKVYRAIRSREPGMAMERQREKLLALRGCLRS